MQAIGLQRYKNEHFEHVSTGWVIRVSSKYKILKIIVLESFKNFKNM